MKISLAFQISLELPTYSRSVHVDPYVEAQVECIEGRQSVVLRICIANLCLDRLYVLVYFQDLAEIISYSVAHSALSCPASFLF